MKKFCEHLAKVYLAIIVCGIAYYGATKGVKIDFLRTDADIWYFRDTGSYATNDTLHIQMETQIIPMDAPIYLDYRDKESTNATDWAQLASGEVREFLNVNIIVANASNYNYQIWSDWTPGPAVHTNGVLKINWALSSERESDEVAINAKPIKTVLDLKEDGYIPYDYTVCEYLEGTGTQWIESGFKADNASGARAKSAIITHANDQHIFGVCGVGDTRFMIDMSSKGILLDWGKFTYTINYPALNRIYDIELNYKDSRKAKVDGVEYTNVITAPLGDTVYTVAIFAAKFRTANANYFYKGRIYELEFTQGEEVVRNFVPCLDASGRPCMFDTIGKQTYYNQGSGEFLYKVKEN